MPSFSYAEATRNALANAMANDPRILVIGPDLAAGGLFGTTRGLLDRFGADRIRQVAGLERSAIGLCLGAAIAGARAVLDLTYSERLNYGIGELVQFASTWPALMEGSNNLSMVLRVAIGPALGAGPFLSGNHHSLLASLPSLRVAAPSSPRLGAAMLQTALSSDGPVILLEHKALLQARGDIPEDDPPVALERAEVIREGRDLTLVAYGAMNAVAWDAAKVVAKSGNSIEVIDLRSLAPLDVACVARSVAKTGRLLLVDDAYGSCSIMAELAAQIAAHAFDYLDAPIHRLSPPLVPAPYGFAQQESFAPQVQDVVRAIAEQLKE